MTTLRFIFGDQLSDSIATLSDLDKANDIILMTEVMSEATSVAHHKKKIVFLFSAMRHFAQALQNDACHVVYTRLDDPHNSGCFFSELERVCRQYAITKIIVTAASEYRVLQDIHTWQARLNIPVSIREDTRFLCRHDEFATWANARKQLRMEYFYREMRIKYQILMEDSQPVGGQWNYDASNRKPPQNSLSIPAPYQIKPDTITRDVMKLVAERFPHHFGDIEPFHLAVTRDDALAALALFIQERLARFGDYQDAMLENEPWMFHSHLSFYTHCTSRCEVGFI